MTGPTATSPGGDRLLVLLHGHGDDPTTLLARRDEIDPDRRCTVVAPTGPVRLADGTPAWFDDGDAADARRLHEALADVLTDGAAAVGCEPSEAIVVGWSQGGAAALALSTWPDGPVVAAVGAVAGWLPSFEGVVWRPRPGLPTLVVHGEDDEVVPLPLGRSAARHLERSGVDVTWRAHEVGHELTPEVLADVATWLADRTRS